MGFKRNQTTNNRIPEAESVVARDTPQNTWISHQRWRKDPLLFLSSLSLSLSLSSIHCSIIKAQRLTANSPFTMREVKPKRNRFVWYLHSLYYFLLKIENQKEKGIEKKKRREISIQSNLSRCPLWPKNLFSTLRKQPCLASAVAVIPFSNYQKLVELLVAIIDVSLVIWLMTNFFNWKKKNFTKSINTDKTCI